MFMVMMLLLVLAVVPFVLGFFPRGSEWLMRPSMYLNLYLLFMANLGMKVKDFVSAKL